MFFSRSAYVSKACLTVPSSSTRFHGLARMRKISPLLIASTAAEKSCAAVMRMRIVSGCRARARARNSAPVMPGIM
jgi:hypothetical protein